MSLQVFLETLDSLERQAKEQFAGVVDANDLERLRVEFLGAKNGLLKAAQKQLGAVPVADKPAAGKRFNEVREAIESLLEETSNRLGGLPVAKLTGPLPDCTLPGLPPHLGHLHPITQTIELLKEIMGRLGFTATEGPEVEDIWHYFVALNIHD
ncbi:MAG: phenylalanine--tRNA ligase subunit alpha, partial [Pirellulaceae bacterium]